MQYCGFCCRLFGIELQQKYLSPITYPLRTLVKPTIHIFSRTSKRSGWYPLASSADLLTGSKPKRHLLCWDVPVEGGQHIATCLLEMNVYLRSVWLAVRNQPTLLFHWKLSLCLSRTFSVQKGGCRKESIRKEEMLLLVRHKNIYQAFFDYLVLKYNFYKLYNW